jgi:hypothetical protein
MRIIVIAAFTGLVATAAHADTMKNCAAAWKAMTPADKAATTYKAYSATCLKKGTTAGTANGSMTATPPPAGATAMCKDNTYSTSKTASGRCSSHGGVAKAL